MKTLRFSRSSAAAIALLPALALGQAPPGEHAALGQQRTSQADIAGGAMTLREIRQAGLKMFATPFNKLDGYGDGPMAPPDTTNPGHRPTLQGNGTFLRINGLDAQTCMECHSVGSNAAVPFRFAVGGVGSASSNAMFKPRDIDVDDQAGNGFAAFNGRFINPPFLFGSGGVELLGLEMTRDLQDLKRRALANPGTPVALLTKGVDFGTIMADAGGVLDTSNVHGVDPDLVVRPFGRKGEFPTVRAFDLGAMMFHLGMQPVEVVGEDVDGDGDGVTNEIRVGEISALSIFNTNLERPRAEKLDKAAERGRDAFTTLGCAECHRPELRTLGRLLPCRYPEVATDPDANVYFVADLSRNPPAFERTRDGGLVVPLFADLKRHDMGPGLAENFSRATAQQNREFTTARLWGVADTAPYLHDGRATTLTEAILMHGGEAQAARDNFAALDDAGRDDLLAFLGTLRTPEDPAKDVVQEAQHAGDKRKSVR
jgi:hypothetical protein